VGYDREVDRLGSVCLCTHPSLQSNQYDVRKA
jgi:hypothetical protein